MEDERERKQPSANILAGLTWRLDGSGLRADGLKAHCGSRISEQNVTH